MCSSSLNCGDPRPFLGTPNLLVTTPSPLTPCLCSSSFAPSTSKQQPGISSFCSLSLAVFSHVLLRFAACRSPAGRRVSTGHSISHPPDRCCSDCHRQHLRRAWSFLSRSSRKTSTFHSPHRGRGQGCPTRRSHPFLQSLWSTEASPLLGQLLLKLRILPAR